MTEFGSKQAGRKGGKARAKNLTKEKRSDIARKGAAARWAKDAEERGLPKALCGGSEPLRIGDIEFPCYVLEDGAVPTDEDRRVITTSGMRAALGMTSSGGSPRLVAFARQIADNPSMGNNLAARLESPIEFIPPNGGIAKGYPATLLADLCDSILEARMKGKLTERYQNIANAAEVVMRGFANVGIIALIDEATGYQSLRRRLELAEILDRYLDDKLNKWTKTFDDDYYIELFRLKGWDYKNLKPGDSKPAEIGKITRDIVYRTLHPGIVEELERMNPYVVTGKRMHKHHQWLTREVGHVELKIHLTKIITTMKFSNDFLEFKQKLSKIVPMVHEQGWFDKFFDEDKK